MSNNIKNTTCTYNLTILLRYNSVKASTLMHFSYCPMCYSSQRYKETKIYRVVSHIPVYLLIIFLLLQHKETRGIELRPSFSAAGAM